MKGLLDPVFAHSEEHRQYNLTMAYNINPYCSDAISDMTLDKKSSRWPLRLTCGLVGLPILVCTSLPSIQMSRSTSDYDRTIGAMEALVWLVPAMVILPVLAISVLRMVDASKAARQVALVLCVTAMMFDAWLCIELLGIHFLGSV